MWRQFEPKKQTSVNDESKYAIVWVQFINEISSSIIDDQDKNTGIIIRGVILYRE